MYGATTPTPPAGFQPFGDWISEVFRLWAARWQVYVLQGLIYFSLIVLLPMMAAAVAGIAAGTSQRSADAGIMVGYVGFYVLLGFAAVVIHPLLHPGMVNTALKQLRGGNVSVGDLFSGTRYFWGTLITGFLAGLGVILCCIGVYATTGLLSLAVPIMVDRRASTSEAISLSWKITTQNFWLYVLFALVMMFLASAGSMACYIGLVATLPFLPIAQAVAYSRTFTCAMQTQGPSAMPVPPPYLPPPPQA